MNPKLLKLLSLYAEWKTVPMKFKILSLSGISFPAIVLLISLFGCSVNQDFVALMEQTNAQIIKEWSEDAGQLPGMNRLPEADQKQLIEELLAPAYTQKLGIEKAKEKAK